MMDIGVDIQLNEALSVDIGLTSPIEVPITLAPTTDIQVDVVATGPQGDQGDTGPANVLAIGDVETGSAAGATITGTTPSQVLNLTLPKGDSGQAASINIGTVTTLPAGQSATVDNSGTPSEAVFDFGIPAGHDGDMQKSVYDPNNKAADAFNYNNLDNTPSIPSNTSDLTNNLGFITASGAPVQTVAGKTGDVTLGATDLTATGISSSKYLRGDNTWQTPTNTTYSAMSVAEGEAGTATTSRVVRADYLEQIIQYYVQQALLAMNSDIHDGWNS